MYFSCTIVRNLFCQFRLNEYDDENRQDSIFHLEDTTLGAIFKIILRDTAMCFRHEHAISYLSAYSLQR